MSRLDYRVRPVRRLGHSPGELSFLQGSQKQRGRAGLEAISETLASDWRKGKLEQGLGVWGAGSWCISRTESGREV